MDYHSYVECDSAAFSNGLSRQGEVVSARAARIYSFTRHWPTTYPQKRKLVHRAPTCASGTATREQALTSRSEAAGTRYGTALAPTITVLSTTAPAHFAVLVPMARPSRLCVVV